MILADKKRSCKKTILGNEKCGAGSFLDYYLPTSIAEMKGEAKRVFEAGRFLKALKKDKEMINIPQQRER